jgi:hypothetical protein
MVFLLASIFQDYSELIAVSVGLNLAYIALSQYMSKGDNSQTPFYEILARYAKNTITQIEEKQTKGLDSLEKNQTLLEYYVSFKNIPPDALAIFNNIIGKYKELQNKVRNITISETTRVENYINFKYYPQLSLFLATYGLLLLFIGPLETRLRFDPCGLLFFTNFIVLFSLLHSVIWELPTPLLNDPKREWFKKRKEKINRIIKETGKFLSPKFSFIIIFFFLFIAFFFLAIKNREFFTVTLKTEYPFIFRNSLVFSIILCYSNFMFYFALTAVRHKISVDRFKKALKAENLDEKVRSYEELEIEPMSQIKKGPLMSISEMPIEEIKSENGSPKEK